MFATLSNNRIIPYLSIFISAVLTQSHIFHMKRTYYARYLYYYLPSINIKIVYYPMPLEDRSGRRAIKMEAESRRQGGMGSNFQQSLGPLGL